MEREFIDLTPKNLANEHLCCIIRSKTAHPGVEAKRRWLAGAGSCRCPKKKCRTSGSWCSRCTGILCRLSAAGGRDTAELRKTASPSQSHICSTALPKGEPLAKPETLPYCQRLSLWERWHGVSRDGEGEAAKE